MELAEAPRIPRLRSRLVALPAIKIKVPLNSLKTGEIPIGTFLQLYMNGFYTGLFFLTLYGMVFKRPVYTVYRTTPGLFVALILMYILSTVHAVGDWILMKFGSIDNGDTAESAALHLANGGPLWLFIIRAVSLVVSTVIADLVMLWRCWTIWNNNWVASAFFI
ncbi:hypothetical protein FB45DRAFT_1149986 [Roridomyces roridus]|uniref:Uncharacterized protein n=1 Tax=Roridomyces roridus TaxID=1738132 RepID=A0AAD7AYV2_9AGAR|nr:hypothetical protein FB45DRAFT_1149986 [Roridomyces roridus]